MLQLQVADLSVGVVEGQEEEEWIEHAKDLQYWTRMLDIVDKMEQGDFSWKDTEHVTIGKEHNAET